MSFFKKIFDQFQKKEEEYKIPSSSDPLNQAEPILKFAQLFTLSGGYFNHCIDEKEMLGVLYEVSKIEKINQYYCSDPLLQRFLNIIDSDFSEKINPNCDAAFITCEHLIAYDGKIMLSTDNLTYYTPSQLPNKIVIIATVSQVQENLSSAMALVKKKSHIKNTTSISGPKAGLSFEDSLQQKIILIVLEDHY